MDIPRPEDVEGILSLPIVVMYWPLIVGTLLFFIALAKGQRWMVLSILVATIGLQVLHLGVGS